MTQNDDTPTLPDETIAHYGSGNERERLAHGMSRLELARTRDLVRRFLPAASAVVPDIGGGPGGYAAWLVREGYRVQTVDAIPPKS